MSEATGWKYDRDVMASMLTICRDMEHAPGSEPEPSSCPTVTLAVARYPYRDFA